jgi:hypothetical protein
MQDGNLIEVNVHVTEYLVCVTYNKDCMEKLQEAPIFISWSTIRKSSGPSTTVS